MNDAARHARIRGLGLVRRVRIAILLLGPVQQDRAAILRTSPVRPG